jgi:hypothetical protein
MFTLQELTPNCFKIARPPSLSGVKCAPGVFISVSDDARQVGQFPMGNTSHCDDNGFTDPNFRNDEIPHKSPCECYGLEAAPVSARV